jgi:predicted ATPase/DNA-binding XRE family transcriptional regulator
MLPPMSTRTSFGSVLRRLRQDAGLTQQELAERADLTPHAVSSLERGTRTRPYPHTVRSLADALGATEDERAELIAAVPRRGSIKNAESRPHGIVVPPTPLYGRGDDIAALANLTRSHERLVTLVGPAGVGKTRLVAALAEELAPEFADGVVTVSLAAVLDASAVIGTVARALGLSAGDGPEASDAVAAHLRDFELLLVLDNLEHVLSAAPQVSRVVASCPSVTVLATSRSPLRVRGEREYLVEPLALPSPTATTSDELGAAPAGALVLNRLSSMPAPQLDVEACVELCHRLAGLPLALELATAQLRLLSPRALLDRLDEVAATSGARDLPERQRTMRATFDWSYALLDVEEQRLFRLMGAFRGGATIEAVEYVAGAPVLELLMQLVEHSLVAVRNDRITMLEPVAQYARSLLVGDEATRVSRAHAGYFVELTAQAAVGYERSEQVGWLARIEADEANILLAIERSLDSGDSGTAARITWHMWLYWWLRGQLTVGRRLAEQCLTSDLTDWERARAHLTAATMSYAARDQQAAAAHWAAADELGDAEVAAKARAGVGLAAMGAGDLDLAEARFRVALEHSDSAEWISSLVHVWLGTLRLLRGDPVAAVPEIERGLDSARARGDRLSTYVARFNLAQAALAVSDLRAARTHLEEGITLSQETGDLANLAHFLEALAVVESQEGAHQRVATLLGASAGLRETVGADVYAYYLPDQAIRAEAEQSARAFLGADQFDDVHDAGRSLDAAHAVQQAWSAG